MNKAKSDNRYFFWSASIIICAILSVFALIFSSCVSSDPKPAESSDLSEPADGTAQVDGENTDETTPANTHSNAGTTATRLGETEDMGQEYIDKFVFLGDSTTYGLRAYNIVPASQVWTPKSGTLTLSLWEAATIDFTDNGTEISIKDAVAAKKPEYLLITLGVNGVSFMGEETFIQSYTGLVKAVQEANPDTKIILNSIYPVTSVYPESTGITNAKIEAANGWIESIAADCGVKYLDSASVLKDENGALTMSYCNDEKLHLNTDGFDKVTNYIRTHGWQ